MRRVMLDIETLGLEPGHTVLSIGAAEFGSAELGETYYRSIDRVTCYEAGLTVDEETLEWWEDQDGAAREVLEGGDDLGDVLGEFVEWIGDADEVWANSPKFDAAILEAAGDAVDVPMPWEFYELRDFRTLKSLPACPDVEHDGVAHDALDDAKHQAYVAAATLERLHSADYGTEADGSGGEI